VLLAFLLLGAACIAALSYLLAFQLLPQIFAEGEAEVAEARVIEKCRQIEALQAEVAALRSGYSATRTLLKEDETRLGALESGGFEAVLGAARAVPAIAARVTSVGEEVILDAGAADGVKVGFGFSVYRGADFVGSVRVTRVELLSCRARVTRLHEGAWVQEGDEAATRFE